MLKPEIDMKIKVKCTYFIDVEVSDDPEYSAKFDIEENHCPGTGIVGATLDQVRREAEAEHICWACLLGGENEIVSE
jgi:hypothetical protein